MGKLRLRKFSSLSSSDHSATKLWIWKTVPMTGHAVKWHWVGDTEDKKGEVGRSHYIRGVSHIGLRLEGVGGGSAPALPANQLA